MPMWLKRQMMGHRLMEEETGGEGGAGGGEMAPDVKALIEKAVNAEVAGLKQKNRDLIDRLKERDDRLKSFDGIDPDAVRNILQRFSDDEEAKLIASGKIDEVLNKRTERMKSGFEKETAKERQAREAAEQRAQKFSQRVLENSIRAEASAAGIHQHAIEDALFRAGYVFGLDDDGNAVAKENALGKEGKPLTLKEWFADMKDRAPHWWPAASGGGAAGGGTGGSNQTKGNFGGTKEERLAAIRARFPELKS